MDNKIKLGYWGIRGLGQVSRLLLAYSGLAWEDVKYLTREDWYDKDRTGLDLVFPNLPYIIDGDFKLTESRALNLYIIKKSGKTELLGKTVEDEARVESIIGVLTDIRTTIGPLFFDPDWKSKIEGAITKLTPKLEEFAKFFGDKEFALGYLTVADFHLSEFSHYIENIAPELYKKYPFWARFRASIDNLPEIKAYYESPTAVKGPFFPPSAAIKF